MLSLRLPTALRRLARLRPVLAAERADRPATKARPSAAEAFRRRGAALLRLTLPCVALALRSALAAPSDESELPAMPDAQVTEVAARMRVNGMPTHIREFRIERPLDEVLAHYRDRFGDRRVEREVMGWRVLARKEGGTLLTVRARAEGPETTVGTLSMADLDAGVAAQGQPLGFVLPAGSEITSDLEMDDPGKRSRLLALSNTASPGANAAHFRRVLEEQGYSLQHDLPADTTHRGRTLWFADGPREALVVIVDLGQQTAVTLNVIRPDEGAR